MSSTSFSLVKHSSSTILAVGVWRGEQVLHQLCSPFFHWDAVAEFEVMEIWEEPDEIQDLSAKAFGFFQGKEPKCWYQVTKALMDVQHEA